MAALEKFNRRVERYPAVGIPHELAERYARWVGGRLPTEAQWEYAARSLGKNYLFVWGNERALKLKNANIDSWLLVPDIPTFEAGYYKKGDATEAGGPRHGRQRPRMVSRCLCGVYRVG